MKNLYCLVEFDAKSNVGDVFNRIIDVHLVSAYMGLCRAAVHH